MRRILVPLDGTRLAASILSDACRLAGCGGELVLIRDVIGSIYSRTLDPHGDEIAAQDAIEYLESVAEPLRVVGMRVFVQGLDRRDAAYAIDEAAARYRADMIACATHGRGPLGRTLLGGVAWRVLAGSPVPVLVRHPGREPESSVPMPRNHRIMVPLDGSLHAEGALTLAAALTREWGASLHLVRIVPSPLPRAMFPNYPTDVETYEEEASAARSYLDRIASALPAVAAAEVRSGNAVSELIAAVGRQAITDIVMVSHGRTGVHRLLQGSVADELLQRLHIPLIVIPSMVPARLPQTASVPGAKTRVPALTA